LTCGSSNDCPQGYTCSASNGCILGPVALDASDCSSGCPSGYVCKLSSGHAQCVPAGSLPYDAAMAVDAATFDAANVDDNSDATATDATPGDAAFDAPFESDASESAAFDAADAQPRTPCNANTDCAGARCIDGLCTPQSQLCSDSTQCTVAGEACVDGLCEPHCNASAPCPAGFGCDFIRGVCNLNLDPCTGSGASTCRGGSRCVEGHCVPPCGSGDAGTSCPAGQLCVNGGCIPDEAARFACKNDGKSGLLANACSATGICLHHDCYTGCDPDAGAAACSDPAAVCKDVTVAAGTYRVCAGTANLGSECDAASGKSCSTGVCIDGYCR
jgi:hypothetical protein